MREWDECECGRREWCTSSNSKHWFTTSFLRKVPESDARSVARTSCVCSGWLRTVRARGTTRRRQGVRSAGHETSGGVGATAGLRLKCVNTGSSNNHSSGAVWESRWPSWAVRPYEPHGFHGRKAILNRAHGLVSPGPKYVIRHPRTLSITRRKKRQQRCERTLGWMRTTIAKVRVWMEFNGKWCCSEEAQDADRQGLTCKYAIDNADICLKKCKYAIDNADICLRKHASTLLTMQTFAWGRPKDTVCVWCVCVCVCVTVYMYVCKSDSKVTGVCEINWKSV